MPTANLASRTGETIQISFSTESQGPSPGSANWSLLAQNIQITVRVPDGRPLPPWFMAQVFSRHAGSVDFGNAQAIILQNPGGREYSGTASKEVIIGSGPSLKPYDYDQRYEFTPEGSGSAGSLIDPVNGTTRFQTNLYLATDYPTDPH